MISLNSLGKSGTPPETALPRTRVSVCRTRNGALRMVRAYVQNSDRTPCGEIVRKEYLIDGSLALPSDRLVACLVCGDEPFGQCECGKWGQP